MNDLNILRQKIDEIDDKIVELISQRFKQTNEIGLIKAHGELPLVDENRESEIISRLLEKSETLSLNPDLITSIYRSILTEVVSNHNLLMKKE